MSDTRTNWDTDKQYTEDPGSRCLHAAAIAARSSAGRWSRTAARGRRCPAASAVSVGMPATP